MDYIEKIQKIIDLLETIEEGLYHIQRQLTELRYEASHSLLNDCINGIKTVELAIDTMEDLPKNNMEILLKIVYGDINKMLLIYEKEQKLDLEKIIGNNLISIFETWKEEVENTIRIVH